MTALVPAVFVILSAWVASGYALGSQRHRAILDELEWKREDARISIRERDQGVDDLIALVGAVDGILQAQAQADAQYFSTIVGRTFSQTQLEQIHATVLKAYRWQYIVSGVQHPHFARLLTGMTTPSQMSRIQVALAPIYNA